MRPLGNRILVERIEGHGIETVLPSGIILPATREKSVQTKRDTFRAKVIAMSDEACRQVPELRPGDEVLVYTYSGNGQSTWTGVETQFGIFIEPDDIVSAMEAA